MQETGMSEEPRKTCNSCKRRLALSAYSVTTQGGLAMRCDDCRVLCFPHHSPSGEMVKWCPGCAEALPVGSFSKSSGNSSNG